MRNFQSNTIMKHKQRSPTRSMISIVMPAFMVIMQFQTAESVEPKITLPGCQDRCGVVSIPFPFGISNANCYLPGFEIECDRDTINYTRTKPTFRSFEVHSISLPLGQLRVNNPISYQCYNRGYNNLTSNTSSWDLSGTPFYFNHENNKFTVIGCDTLAYIHFGNKPNLYWGGCVLRCDSADNIIDGYCSGGGCCQTPIPPKTNHYEVSFDKNFNNSKVYNFSRCSYAFIMEDDFNFSSDYITTDRLDKENMTLVLDWAVGNDTCKIAQSNKTSNYYACISDKSYCVNATNGPGYYCKCSPGYDGNPYLQGGCQDINECDNKSRCSYKCHNLPGTYRCSCPVIMRLNTNSTAGDCELYMPSLIGVGVGILLLVFFGFCMFVVFERRKLSKVKEMYFQQHGGWILLEEIKSNMGLSFTIFSKQEVEQATNNFDNANIIGQGGQGTVYKGTVKDQLVAIKKCKIIDEGKKKEFGKEMIILSQISHKNIVKLLGCCLEVEVPMLVYEFISNGTLYDHIHHQKHGFSIFLEDRLRIAHESAEALAYLHYSASPPIFHGDIKSSNILLDEKLIAKVSDFGASILSPTDESQFVTLVQGTCGYLDPEYVQSCQLTDKSDVYSFAVVLLELLTSKPVVDFEATTDEKSLSSLFLSAMKENNINELLDVQIKREEDMETIYRVAELAKECLNVKREDRPTMKEVADQLERIRKLRSHPWGNINHEETEILLGESSICGEIQHTGNFSIERTDVQNIALGR